MSAFDRVHRTSNLHLIENERVSRTIYLGLVIYSVVIRFIFPT